MSWLTHEEHEREYGTKNKMKLNETKYKYCVCKAIIHLKTDNIYKIDDQYYCDNCWAERDEEISLN